MRDKTILVTGGGGYVGSALVPTLLAEGYVVRVLDWFIYGESVLDPNPDLQLVKGDIRDRALVDAAMRGVHAVIHLACISNDPSYDLNPELGRSVNFDAFRPIVESARSNGVRRFIYASSSSVYGINDAPEVTEDLSLKPLTDYSRFKAECEAILAEYESPTFTTTTLRPATVCGYARRQRLDVIVNIFCNLAVNRGEISVFGGAQKRPNLHIQDMVRAYLAVLQAPTAAVGGKIWNVGGDNHTVHQLAQIVRDVVGPHVKTTVTPTNDNRSYHISSERIRRDLGFVPQETIRSAVRELAEKMRTGHLPDSLTNPLYFNIKRMQELDVK